MRLKCLKLVLCLLLATAPAFGQNRRGAARASNPNKKVRLVVGIVIDQFRADYLTRFEDLFGEGGFRRLLRGGAVFTNARYIHTPTYTACGHATFMSGATPALNGIVGNEWYERETGKRVTSVLDAGVKPLGGREGAAGASPARLLSSTLGDELRLSSQSQSKVVGIALKDRSAILPAGKRPNGAYWYDSQVGAFVSSTYYFSDLPEWVKKFNREQRPDRYFGATWDRLLPEAAYRRSLPDDSAYEKSSLGGNKFPYQVTGGEAAPGPKFYSQFELTPFANEYTVAFARAAIEAEGLGADDQTDLLTVSFSANDILGHAYGPYSQEVEDMTVRTDRVFADFFNYLDQRIGLENTLIALTADHGVAPVPEQARDLGIGGRLDPKAVTDAIEGALDGRFGEEKWVLSFVNSNVYLDQEAVARRKLDRADVEREAGEAVLRLPGIAYCYTRAQIMAGQIPPTPVARSVAHGFFAQRNGDLVVVPAPFFMFGEGLATTHGTPYGYDAHVPVIFFGAGVAAGHYAVEASPADIAPTLAALLKVEPPSNAVGRILTDALKPNP